MVGAALVGAVLACLVFAGVVVSGRLGASGGATRILSAYLVCWTLVVAWTLGLSTIDALTRTGLVVAASATALGAALLLVNGPPRRRGGLRAWAGRLRSDLRDPVVGVPAVAVVLGYAYTAVIGVTTPQNDGDPLVYELTRAALWRQQHAVGIVGDGVDPRLDGNPIVGELGQATWLTLAGSERFVWIGQWTAVIALVAGCFALARRLGFERREAALSAAVVPTLAVIPMQSATAYVDLVAAAFLVAAFVFALGSKASELALLAVSVGLALSTKFSGPIMLPLVFLLAVSSGPGRLRSLRIVAVGAGVVAGSWWYVVNLVQAGNATGGTDTFADQTPVRTVGATALRLQQLLLDAFDVSGVWGLWSFGYAVVGAAFLLWGLRERPERTWSRRDGLLLGTTLVVLPLAVATSRAALQDCFAWAWRAAGSESFAFLVNWRGLARMGDGARSWFGPVLVPMTVVAVILAFRSRRDGAARAALLVAASAPIIGVALIAVSIVYDPWRGRFLVAPVVLGVATWGLVTRSRWVAVAVSTCATVGLVLCLSNWAGKPTALSSASSSESIWSMPRWRAELLLRFPRGTAPGEARAVRFVDERVPRSAAIAVRVGGNDFRFVYFGAALDRKVELLGAREAPPPDATWLVQGAGLPVPLCRGAWRAALDAGSGWRVLERASSTRECAPGTG